MTTLERLARRARRPALLGAVAASVLAPAAGATPPTVTRAGAAFSGVTAQGMAVRLGPRRGTHRSFRYRARLSCSDNSTFTDDPFIDSVRLRAERFSLSRWTDARAVHVVLIGVIRGRSAHGTLRITERYSEVPDSHGDTPLNANGGILCDSGTVPWRARLTGT